MLVVVQPALPVSARLAWWGTAWLRGAVVTDLVLDAVLLDDATHVVAGLPGRRRLGAPGAGAGRAADRPVYGSLGLALPGTRRPGRDRWAAGLQRRPPSRRRGRRGRARSDSCRGAWVRRSSGRRTPRRRGSWSTSARPTAGSGAALQEAARAPGRPGRGALAARGGRRADEPAPPPRLKPPPGTPERCVDLAGRALQARAIVDLALEDDGGAVSATEVAARWAALQPLGAAARRGLVAACSPEVWPDL